MAHFMECLDTKFLGALHFTDVQMRPKPRTLTVKSVQKGRPPAAGKNTKPKWCVYFEECEKGAFFSNGQLKKLANTLMCADPDGWVGSKLTISCAPTTYGGQAVMGMVIVKAERSAQAQRTHEQHAPEPDDTPPEPPDDYIDPDEVHGNG
jgi:hypothetical protein